METSFRDASLVVPRTIFIRIARDQAERKIQSEMLTGLATENAEKQHAKMAEKVANEDAEIKDVARAAGEEDAATLEQQRPQHPTLHLPLTLPHRPYPTLRPTNHRHRTRGKQAWQGFGMRLLPCGVRLSCTRSREAACWTQEPMHRCSTFLASARAHLRFR